MKLVTLLAILASLVADARSAVPDAVRQLPWRREVILPAAAAAEAWCLVELDSLLSAVTAGDLARLRLVDDAGEPIPAVVLAARWPELHAVALPLDTLAWRQVADEPRTFTATVALPPGRYLRASWRGDGVADVSANAEVAPTWQWGEIDRATPSVTWVAPGDSLRLTVTTSRSAPPALSLDRLTLRQDRLRRVPFVARDGVFRGTDFEQVVDLPAGPHPVVAVTLAYRAEAQEVPAHVDVRTPDGRWERLDATAREGVLEATGDLLPAQKLRLGAAAADPPNPPFTVTGVEVLPPAFAFAADVRRPVWLVYGEHPVPAPPGLPRDRLERVAELSPVGLGAPEPNPWFTERFLGSTWLRRRPLAVTAAMVVVLGAVAWLVLPDRRSGVA